MNWKVSLDKYLTTPPDDGFDNWCDLTIEAISDEFFNENEEWILDSQLSNKWLNSLFHKSPTDAAKIIERAYNIFIKKN